LIARDQAAGNLAGDRGLPAGHHVPRGFPVRQPATQALQPFTRIAGELTDRKVDPKIVTPVMQDRQAARGSENLRVSLKVALDRLTRKAVPKLQPPKGVRLSIFLLAAAQQAEQRLLCWNHNPHQRRRP